MVCERILILKPRPGLNVHPIQTNTQRKSSGTWYNVVCREDGVGGEGVERREWDEGRYLTGPWSCWNGIPRERFRALRALKGERERRARERGERESGERERGERERRERGERERELFKEFKEFSFCAVITS